MAAPIALREDFDALALRGLAKKTRDVNQSRRLLALAAIYDGGLRGQAARIGGIGLQTMRDWVRKEIGPIASPDLIQFAPGLPKTRSGKIMRRILRKIAGDEFGNLGDTSTLADPSVVDDLIEHRQNRKQAQAPEAPSQ